MNVPELFDISGRKALVTGAGRGIGRVYALALAQAGCDISILEINAENAEKVAGEIRDLGRKADVFTVDVTNKAELEKTYAATAEKLGGLDICVHNAGVNIYEAAEDTPEENYDYVVDTNMKGVFLCCQAAFPIMKVQKKGSIINIASMSGDIVNYPQKHVHYNAAKAGVILISKCLAVEWAPFGIRVNSLSPGYTRTEMTGIADPDVVSQWEALTPMGRMAEPEELAGAVLYLASDASSFTTGSNFIVDGGFTAR